MLDSLALTSADVAIYLDLLENTGSKHVLLDLDTMSTTAVAGVDLSISASTSLAFLANLLLLELEFGRVAVVKIA
jgi:hypothetical protein